MAKRFQLRERDTGTALYPYTAPECVLLPGGGNLKQQIERPGQVVAVEPEVDTEDATMPEDTPDVYLHAVMTVPQVLTDEQKSTAKQNLGIVETMLFDDMWVSIGGTKLANGKYRMGADGKELTLDEAMVRYERNGFIVKWNRECGTDGGYNEATCYFELNGLTDITYEQAVDIDNFGTPFMGIGSNTPTYIGVGYEAKVRTILPLVDKENWTRVLSSCFPGSNFVEVLILKGSAIRGYMWNYKLKVLKCKDIRDNICTSHMPMLEEFRYINPFHITRCDKSFAESSNLSLQSLEDLVYKEPNGTTAVTFTVHPDVYDKLTGGATEDVEAWEAVWTTAVMEKNIIFATT